jgi:hypothetical protein
VIARGHRADFVHREWLVQIWRKVLAVGRAIIWGAEWAVSPEARAQHRCCRALERLKTDEARRRVLVHLGERFTPW